MNITRHNYEEYFVLYMDNELGSEDRRQVELFVKENPDLQEELSLLKQTLLTADDSCVFSNKEELLKTAGAAGIDENNYEEWLLFYTDNELSANQKKTVEKFIASHPNAKAEFDFFQKIKLQADPAIVFTNKEMLYRREEKVRAIGSPWKRIAAAAALLLAVSTTALVVFNSKKDKGEIAAGPVKENIIRKTPVIEGSKKETLTDPQVANHTSDKTEKETPLINDQVAKEKKHPEQKQKTTPYIPAEVKQQDVIVTEHKEKKNMNGLPQPTHNPYVNKIADQENPIAGNLPVKESLTIPKENKQTQPVTPHTTQPLDHIETASLIEPTDPVDEERPGKKNKLRGFFRKVTRTFEKNTNIKATDDEDRLLLGGLAIKL